MVGKKSALQSKSVWGSILVLAGLISTSLGWDIGDQNMWVNTILEFIGAGLALYGRIVAVKPIG